MYIHLDGFGNEIKKNNTQKLLTNSKRKHSLNSSKKSTTLYNNVKNYKPIGIYSKDIIKKLDNINE